MPETRPNLFQFWDKPDPPEEVAALMTTWEADSDFRYRRFDAGSAESYIAAHFGERARNAFRQCAVPAMQADFFRYCALCHEGGVYVDADTENAGAMSDLLADGKRGILMSRNKRIANDFLFVRRSRDPLFEKIVEVAIRNVENRISNSVWQVTGPGILTRLRNDPSTSGLFDGFAIKPVQTVRGHAVKFHRKMDYKQSGTDWRLHFEKGIGGDTIFRKA